MARNPTELLCTLEAVSSLLWRPGVLRAGFKSVSAGSHLRLPVADRSARKLWSGQSDLLRNESCADLPGISSVEGPR